MTMEQLASTEAKAHDVRGELRDDEEAIRLMDHPDSDEDIPTLDIAPYLSGDALIEVLPTCHGPGPRCEPITYAKLREWYYSPRA
jgi:hypothetical protein